jgi:hypothetical protein
MIARIAKSYELQFQDGREWRKLPAWAKFFVELGASLEQVQTADRKVVVAASVPTSSFAAAFISLGRVLGEQIQEPAKSAVDAHFQKLAGLRHGTPLVYFDDHALYCGPFRGITQRHDEDYILISTKKTNYLVPKARCLFIELQPESEDGLGLAASNGRLRKPKPFVSQFFSLAEHYRVSCSTTKSVLIVGEKNRLRTELQSPFQIPNGNKSYDGTLQDLVRVAKFSAGGIGCRADVLARSRGHLGPANLAGASKSLVVLDGAGSVIKWAHQFLHSDSVSILSRTDADFSIALDLANTRYLNRLDDCILPDLGAPPSGIEIMAHVERRQ